MLFSMLSVTETEAAAIHEAFRKQGEFSAVVELRRLFPGITDTMQAQECVRTIADWKDQGASGVTPLGALRGRECG
jgi:hypothetical protein